MFTIQTITVLMQLFRESSFSRAHVLILIVLLLSRGPTTCTRPSSLTAASSSLFVNAATATSSTSHENEVEQHTRRATGTMGGCRKIRKSINSIDHDHDKKDHHAQADKIQNNGIVTLPLLHRDQVIARKRRELRNRSRRQEQRQNINSGQDGDDVDEEADEDAKSSSDENIISQVIVDDPANQQEINDSTTGTHYNEHEMQGDEDFEDLPPITAQLFQGIGTHYVDVWIGHPNPQRQTLIVDTGSGLVSFPCTPCDDCGESYHTDGYFKNDDSTTFILETCDNCHLGKCKQIDDFELCGMSMGYGEGSSWHAYESRDYAYIGGSHAAGDYSFELKFGCQYKITGLFKTQLADGIMVRVCGFMKHFHFTLINLSSTQTMLSLQTKGMENSSTSFWNQMYAADMIASKSFSLCYQRPHQVSREGTQAGSITLGGTDKTMHSSPMVFAEHIDVDGKYSVYIQDMYLKHPRKEDENSKSVDDATQESSFQLMDGHRVVKMDVNASLLNMEGVIVDSGTTESYFPALVKLPFMKAFEQLMGFEFLPKISKDSSKVTDAMEIEYPTILIQMKAATTVADDELMDEKCAPLPGLAGILDLDHPNDVIFEITPEQYMLWSKNSDAYTNRFHLNDEFQFGILGANSMYGHNILFDMEKNRLGFAKSDCNII